MQEGRKKTKSPGTSDYYYVKCKIRGRHHQSKHILERHTGEGFPPQLESGKLDLEGKGGKKKHTKTETKQGLCLALGKEEVEGIDIGGEAVCGRPLGPQPFGIDSGWLLDKLVSSTTPHSRHLSERSRGLANRISTIPTTSEGGEIGEEKNNEYPRRR